VTKSREIQGPTINGPGRKQGMTCQCCQRENTVWVNYNSIELVPTNGGVRSFKCNDCRMRCNRNSKDECHVGKGLTE
jgi:hypothetical protein